MHSHPDSKAGLQHPSAQTLRLEEIVEALAEGFVVLVVTTIPYHKTQIRSYSGKIEVAEHLFESPKKDPKFMGALTPISEESKFSSHSTFFSI